MAVPGHPLDPRSEGPNSLLKKPGVTMVTSAEDVLAVLAPMRGRGGRSAAKAALEETVAWSGEGASRNDLDAVPALAKESPLAPGTAISTVSASTSAVPAEAVLAVLGPAPITLDEVARATGLGIRDVRIALLELSLAGRVEQHGAQLVSLSQTESE
jgi:DNA processing protein